MAKVFIQVEVSNEILQQFDQDPSTTDIYCECLDDGIGNDFQDIVSEVWGTPDINLAENNALWAACEILGLCPIDHPAQNSQSNENIQHSHKIGKVGHVPHTYYQPEHHIIVRGDGSTQQGFEFLNNVAERIDNALDKLLEYHEKIINH